MKSFIRKFIPKRFMYAYHRVKAETASFIRGNPSGKMVIIGITGTKGKSSTANFIWAGLTGAGFKTGLISTANMKIGESELPNKHHMTMPSPFIIQEMLKRMYKAGCKAAIVETTSEGILQSRNRGINYDFLVFTNLTPEHIRSHGTFENYKKTKQSLFKRLAMEPIKRLDGKLVPKVIIANGDSPEVQDFYKFNADQKFTYGTENEADIKAEKITEGAGGGDFYVNNRRVHLNIPGRFNVLNALPVFAIGKVLALSEEGLIKGLESIKKIPGRMETVLEKPFRVIVDYAHEKESMTLLLKTAKQIANGRIIVLLGAEGGGRDKTKRPIMGEIAGREADVVIVSNVDPYEEDPKQIIKDIAVAALGAGKIPGDNLFQIEDRREGIKKALTTARKGDLVLITGKGSEQSMIIGDKKIPWDDKTVVEELAKELGILLKQ